MKQYLIFIGIIFSFQANSTMKGNIEVVNCFIRAVNKSCFPKVQQCYSKVYYKFLCDKDFGFCLTDSLVKCVYKRENPWYNRGGEQIWHDKTKKQGIY